jgi:hypothetical protein
MALEGTGGLQNTCNTLRGGNTSKMALEGYRTLSGGSTLQSRTAEPDKGYEPANGSAACSTAQ